ncbi:hypothetical protein FNZ56_04955 [Pseudoluteimonas lycopersici]|uniref:DUF4402 domain-containing protein n=1 Tax=Pseudoluteimonas lycopersici TaxID=1324796 RepID=A0A516V403_9GAMM|nr:hypothetical protein [Lysobacter lycopersici]QDQ73260.1 hypothetical protein FNZ56_04955 [Lysobacter lycopersici]
MKNARHATTFAITCLFAIGTIPQARAFVVNIIPTSTQAQIYLRVGDGAFNGTYSGGGTPAASATITRVSVSVPATAVGNAAAQAMTSNATQATSFYDGYAFCNLPAQVYIGGYNRGGLLGAGGNGMLTVTAPTNLTNAGGNTIPFSQISWISSGNGDTGAQPFPSGAFTGGTQTLASFPVNTWRESCHTFSYANANMVAAGTYNGQVTYTLSVP